MNDPDGQTLFSAVVGWTDREISVEIILCALAVAPSDRDVRLMLLAALNARYARVVRQPDVHPPARYPWRRQLAGHRRDSLPMSTQRDADLLQVLGKLAAIRDSGR